jgi:hypothetical protein
MMSVNGIFLVEIDFEEFVVSNTSEVLVSRLGRTLELSSKLYHSVHYLRVDLLIVCLNEILLGDFAESCIQFCCLDEEPLRFQRPVVDLANELDHKARATVDTEIFRTIRKYCDGGRSSGLSPVHKVLELGFLVNNSGPERLNTGATEQRVH